MEKMDRDQIDRVYELYNSGKLSVKEIANRLGISRYKVYRILKKSGIRARKSDMNSFINKISEKLPEGMPIDSYIVQKLREKDISFIRELIQSLGISDSIDEVPEKVPHTILAAIIAEVLTDVSATVEWICEGKSTGQVSRRYLRYRLSIRTRDYDHAVFLSKLMHEGLGKRKFIEPRRYKRIREGRKAEEGYEVIYNDRNFVLWWKLVTVCDRDLGALKRYIEHCDSCIKSFLFTVKLARGRRSRYIYSSNTELLKYIRELCRAIGVRTSRIDETPTTRRLYVKVNDFKEKIGDTAADLTIHTPKFIGI